MRSRFTRDGWKRIRLAAIAILAVPVTMALVPTASKPEEVGLSSERLQRVREACSGTSMRRRVRRRDAGRPQGQDRPPRGAGPDGHRIEEADAEGRHLPPGVDVQADHRRGGDDDGRGREGPPHRSGVALHPRVQGHRRSRWRSRARRRRRPRRAPAGGARGGRSRRAPPEFDTVSAPREITIRDLLTHGSGLMSGGLGEQRRRRSARPTDTLATYIPKLASRAARLPAGHAVALQRPGRLRRAEPHRRGGVGPDVRSVPASSGSSIRSA